MIKLDENKTDKKGLIKYKNSLEEDLYLLEHSKDLLFEENNKLKNLSLINSFYDNPVIQCTDEQFKYFSNVFDMLRDELGEDCSGSQREEN